MLKEQTYKVAEVVFSIELPEDASVWSQMTNYEPFIVENHEEEPVFTVRYCNPLPYRKKELIPIPEADNPLEPKVQLFYTSENELIFEMSPSWRAPLAGSMLLSPDFSSGLLDSCTLFAINNALMLAFAMRTMDMGVLEMHSSVVVNRSFGYMFLGVSGTGKSTHSRLWMENIQDTWLLNDDNPVIRAFKDEIRVYGTPWSGKTPCYKNASAPIGAIVSLCQAPYNRIARQSVPESYAAILSSCSGIKFESRYVDLLHETLSKVISKIPCYTLECLPDGDAARLCHTTVSPKAPLSSSIASQKIEIPNEILLEEVSVLLSEGKDVILMTKGNSMLPFIAGGRDSVRLVMSDIYAKGDVVLAEIAPGHYVLHRIAGISGGEVTLKGDGNLHKEEHCMLCNIKGKVAAVIGLNGKEKSVRQGKIWNRMPYPVRRYSLALIQRII